MGEILVALSRAFAILKIFLSPSGVSNSSYNSFIASALVVAIALFAALFACLYLYLSYCLRDFSNMFFVTFLAFTTSCSLSFLHHVSLSHDPSVPKTFLFPSLHNLFGRGHESHMLLNTVYSTSSYMLIIISLLLPALTSSSFRYMYITIPLHLSLAYLPHFVATSSLLPSISPCSPSISSPAHTTLQTSSSPSDPPTPFLFQSLFTHSTCLLSPELAYLTGLVHVPVALVHVSQGPDESPARRLQGTP